MDQTIGSGDRLPSDSLQYGILHEIYGSQPHVDDPSPDLNLPRPSPDGREQRER
jgi:hypothetical protein